MGLIRVCTCAGKLGISCAASRLTLQLAFEAKHSVSGQVTRSIRAKQQAIARITGSWTGQVKIATHNAKSREPDQEGQRNKRHTIFSVHVASVTDTVDLAWTGDSVCEGYADSSLQTT